MSEAGWGTDKSVREQLIYDVLVAVSFLNPKLTTKDELFRKYPSLATIADAALRRNQGIE